MLNEAYTEILNKTSAEVETVVRSIQHAGLESQQITELCSKILEVAQKGVAGKDKKFFRDKTEAVNIMLSQIAKHNRQIQKLLRGIRH